MLITNSTKLHHALSVFLALPDLDHGPTAPNPQETRNEKQIANHKKQETNSLLPKTRNQKQATYTKKKRPLPRALSNLNFMKLTA
jgi:hypothetical protein